MSQTLMVDLPDSIYQHLQEVAAATQTPIERLVQQSIEGNLPPKFSGAPAEIQAELRALQSLSTAELQTVAARQVPQARQARHLALLEKNSRGTITDVERAELVALRTEADRLMLCRAYAWALLRWRGVPVPDLDDLPLPK